MKKNFSLRELKFLKSNLIKRGMTPDAAQLEIAGMIKCVEDNRRKAIAKEKREAKKKEDERKKRPFKELFQRN